MKDILEEKQYFVCWRIHVAKETTFDSSIMTAKKDETAIQTFERMVKFGEKRFGCDRVVVTAFNRVN